MIHLIISREYPPAVYPPGGIGAYVANIARLLAERGEIVHVIAERSDAAPAACELRHGGRLIIHRIGENDVPQGDASGRRAVELEGLKKTVFPAQWFSWSAAVLAERLIEEEGIEAIEGQEWEAPLYYLLLRRSLGLGPRRHPPVIVHLHSPTEFIHRFNGHLAIPPAFTTMKRMEAFCIRSADALVCPSRYLARQCGEYFGVASERVKVIPLPVGFPSILERNEEVWERGSICFVGRLEPRKGVVEWFEAAMRVAREDPSVQFDFVGADNFGIQSALVERLPQDWHPRFRFHGSKPREELAYYLARARAGVVPSRWENFPNVCIEAMSSGLPVIATRLGGMVELVEDGRTGWLAEDTGVAGMVDGLADALRRCLAASGRERATMGGAAAQAIRRICDNDRVVDAHIAFRTEVRDAGPTVSLRRTAAVAANAPSAGGAVIQADRPEHVANVLKSLENQTQAAHKVVIVSAAPSGGSERPTGLARAQTIVSPKDCGAAAWNRGLAACAQGRLDFVLFLDRHDELMPDCLERVAAVMQARPDVGIVSFWVAHADGSGQFDIAPNPEALYQLIDNDVRPAAAFRVAALPATLFRSGLPRGYDTWDLANAVLKAGWSAVTYPALLARRDVGASAVRWPESTALRAVRAELLRGSPALAHGALELIDLFVPLPLSAASAPATTLPGWGTKELIGYYFERVVFHPVESMRAVRRKVRTRLRRQHNGHAGRRASS